MYCSLSNDTVRHGACEEPVLAAECDAAQLVLGAIVVNGKSTIIDEALQRGPLICQIAHRVADGDLGSTVRASLAPIS